MDDKKIKNESDWLVEKDNTLVDHYLNAADLIIVERRKCIQLLIDIFSYHFENPGGLHFLDLGCGDGVISKTLYGKYPENAFTLLDGSKKMLERAQKNFKGDHVSYIHQTFEEYIVTPPCHYHYNFIYSALAIHHIDFHQKIQLYGKIFRELQFKGLFLLIDTVLPVSERSEKWQLTMWSDWIAGTVTNSDVPDKEKKIKEFQGIAQNNEEDDIPSGLIEQMAELTKIGFRDVDCFYKYGIFALFGGTKW